MLRAKNLFLFFTLTQIEFDTFLFLTKFIVAPLKQCRSQKNISEKEKIDFKKLSVATLEIDPKKLK